MKTNSITEIAKLLSCMAIVGLLPTVHGGIFTETLVLTNHTGQTVNDLHITLKRARYFYDRHLLDPVSAWPFELKETVIHVNPDPEDADPDDVEFHFEGATIPPGGFVTNRFVYWSPTNFMEGIVTFPAYKAHWTLNGDKVGTTMETRVALLFGSNPDGTLALAATNGTEAEVNYAGLSVVTGANPAHFPRGYLEHMASGFSVRATVPTSGTLPPGLTVLASFMPFSYGYSAASLSIGGQLTAVGWSPRPMLWGLRSSGNGLFELELRATPNHRYVLQGSSDLQTWTNLRTNFVTNAVTVLSGLTASPSGRQFYRAMLEPPGYPIQSATNPANGHVYHLLAGRDGASGLTWTEAESLARSYGGHLATVNDATENEWITTTFANGFYLSIGLNDVASEGQFSWSSGEPVTFLNWFPGEPNNSDGGEHYVEIYDFKQGMRQWNDNKDVRNVGDFPVYGVAEIDPLPALESPCVGGVLQGKQAYSECINGCWYVVEVQYYSCPPNNQTRPFRVRREATGQPCSNARPTVDTGFLSRLYPVFDPNDDTCQNPTPAGELVVFDCPGTTWVASFYTIERCEDSSLRIRPSPTGTMTTTTPCSQPPPFPVL